MPRRPPRRWWYSCVRKVEASGTAESPEDVCGDLWHNKMSAADRRKVLKEENVKDNATEKAFSKAKRKTYYCRKCRIYHRKTSKLGKEHAKS